MENRKIVTGAELEMNSIYAMDELVKEYLYFRGFNLTLAKLEEESMSDYGFQVYFSSNHSRATSFVPFSKMPSKIATLMK